MTTPLLEVKNLKTQFKLSQNTVYAVNGVSFRVDKGEVLGIVGESGCGKSVSALSVMRLIDEPGRIVGGEILLHDGGEIIDLVKLPGSKLEKIRGNKISMIFQDPMTCLNPVYSIGFQLAEPLRIHRHLSDDEVKKESIRLLSRVGIPEPERRLKDFPHQLSGGMRQRVMIAMAVACRPNLLIADEPTTALDVTVQAQILELLKNLQMQHQTAMLFITHDMGVIARIADRVAVMYAGRIVEMAPTKRLFSSPAHPYTQALQRSIPASNPKGYPLEVIPGNPPDLAEPIEGCPFAARCNLVEQRCLSGEIPLKQVGLEHVAACVRAQGEAI